MELRSALLVLFTSLQFAWCQRVQVIYEGQNILFHCKATGISPLLPVHYQWEFDNRVLIASDDTFSLRNIRKSDEGEYKCIATQIINNEHVVAVETTFISVRTADSIVTQDVEEGMMVRILCNVTGDGRPAGAGPLRYEWRNPNGTLVGTQWKLELGKIQIHESGVYVCRVSYELENKQMSTSSATRINVLKRAGIIFPGLRDNVVEALETGDVMQECKVISSKPSEYTYSWYGPSSERLVSSTQFLQLDYVLRAKDEGIYRCVAMPSIIGLGMVENEVVLTITPLRFQISTISEDLRLDGFTHRRVTYIPPTDPRLFTRETFTYQWHDPRGNPLVAGQGPDMNVQLRSPEDFGRYSVRVEGLHSRYRRDLSSYVMLDDGIVAPSYTVVIREVSGPLYLNARLELACSTNPPNPEARINWLGPDGTVVSDSSHLVFEKFQLHHQGRYTCQILLPNQVVLRQSVELLPSAIGPEYPGPGGGIYSIRIDQHPLTFRYGDTVRLMCTVTPPPASVQYEWMKDGRIIGRQSELLIPQFTTQDIGRYVCKAQIHGAPELSSNATVSPGPIPPDSLELIMRPSVIYQPVFASFQIECISERPGLLPMAEFSNGAPVESDNQFTISRPSTHRLVISAPRGLSRVYNGYRIRCTIPNVGSKETTLYLIDPCPDSESQCSSQECIPTKKLCDGRYDCSDRSDEGAMFCNAGVTVSPSKIVVQPSQPFSLQCVSQLPGQKPHARLVYTGLDVESDPRFRTQRPSIDVLVIHAPNGLQLSANNTRIECYFPDRGTRIAIINVIDQACLPGGFRCGNGQCIQRSQVCDGVPQCLDRSDEIGCETRCYAPNIACPSGECITPAQRCDGRADCRDGFDERGCPPSCAPPKFSCTSGECIAPGMKCDGKRDCFDGSDEFDCAPTRECLPPNFQCPSGECLALDRRCDGRSDCLDGFDERNCPSDCRPPYIRCPSGECLDSRQICDGQLDCADGWDERTCATPGCRSDQYTCLNGECIDHRLRCDGRLDCFDGSDERGCVPIGCPPDQFKCSTGDCIDQRRRCDGRQDCYDGSDERDCESISPSPPKREYLPPYSSFRIECRSPSPGHQPTLTVNNGTPVEQLPRFEVWRPSAGVIVASISNLTEKDSGLLLSCSAAYSRPVLTEIIIQSPCPSPTEWMCRDGSCVFRDRFCDGRPDCPDGSDEKMPHCDTPPGCSMDQFTCRSGDCVPITARCDGQRDCYDGSDEVDCADGPTIRPDRPVARPYGSIQVECSSVRPGVEPRLTVENGTDVEQLSRFHVNRPSRGVIVARISDLTENDNGLRLRCTYPTGEETSTEIEIETPCGPGEFMCRDGRCMRRELFCDGRADCPDGSDETPPHCTVGLTISPEQITIRPYQRVEVTCASTRPGIAPQLRLHNGSLVEHVANFEVMRPNAETVMAWSSSLTERDRRVIIYCVIPTGETVQSEITISSPCSPSEFMCRDGTCLRSSMFCDGQRDCPDGSDEIEPHCVVSGPTIHPGRPSARPYGSVEVTCESHQFGIRPELRLANGTSVEHLGRFQVHRPTLQKIIARLTDVTERDQGLVIRCLYRTGEFVEVEVGVDTPCRQHERMCRDGYCIPTDRFCDGTRDCPDGSDEQPPHCDIRTDIQITPDRIQVQPYQTFQLSCISSNPAIEPRAQFPDGRPVTQDPRFEVVHVSPNHIDIRVTHGLTERDDDMTIICVFPGVGNRSAAVEVVQPCPPGQYQCKDGTCLPRNLFCNARVDCPDGSDESELYCRVDITVIPGIIVIKQFEAFQFECVSRQTGSAPEVFIDGRPIKDDPRFTLIHPSPGRVIVRADQGVPYRGGHVFQCVSVTGSHKEVIVRMEPACPSGSYQCTSGQCVPGRAFCDGRYDCEDRSDEDSKYCAANVLIIPSYVYVRPYTPFEFICDSRLPGVQPHVRFSDGRPVESDSRFSFTRPTNERIIVRAEHGLTERDQNTRMICYVVSGQQKEILIQLESDCPPGHALCRDGTCLPLDAFCNGRPDCPDRSDEDSKYCAVVQVSVKPGSIRVRPREPFTYECSSTIPGVMPQVLIDGQPPERYPQVRVERPSTERVVINAYHGMPEVGIHVISCSVSGGVGKDVLVTVDGACGPEEFQCGDGTCISTRMVCDGRPDCPEGSDENPAQCPERPPPGRVYFTPGEIRIQPGRPIRLECHTDIPGAELQVTYVDGSPLDGRFMISKPSADRIVVDVPHGMDANSRQVILMCRASTGDYKTSTIYVDQSCQPGQRRCPGGDCIFAGQFCDGKIDCPEGYDERPEMCAICDPIAKPCEPVDGRNPTVSHFQYHWLCDGEDDCGNGFDELNCRNDTRNIDPQCGSTHFHCTSGARQYIPFSYWCDGTVDCEGGEDERECATPAIIEGGGLQPHKVRQGETLVLECEASGVPPPMIIWRFNWNCLPDASRMTTQVIHTARGCRGSRSRLTIQNFRPGDDGIYNCEALVSSHRAMSQDFLVLLAE